MSVTISDEKPSMLIEMVRDNKYNKQYNNRWSYLLGWVTTKEDH